MVLRLVKPPEKITETFEVIICDPRNLWERLTDTNRDKIVCEQLYQGRTFYSNIIVEGDEIIPYGGTLVLDGFKFYGVIPLNQVDDRVECMIDRFESGVGES